MRPGYSKKPDNTNTPRVKRKESTEKEDKEKEEQPKNRRPNDPNIKWVEHKVTVTEDMSIWAVAVMYGVTPDEIRQFNRNVCFEYLDNVVGETLYIPINIKDGDRPIRKPVEDPKKLAEYQFCKLTSAPHLEAQFYLDEANWDVEKAVRQYNDDLEWEKKEGNKKESQTKSEQKKSQPEQQQKPQQVIKIKTETPASVRVQLKTPLLNETNAQVLVTDGGSFV